MDCAHAAIVPRKHVDSHGVIFRLGVAKERQQLKAKACPAKVRTGFARKDMLKQRHRAGGQFEEKSSCSMDIKKLTRPDGEIRAGRFDRRRGSGGRERRSGLLSFL
jgi:hypothetical protein